MLWAGPGLAQASALLSKALVACASLRGELSVSGQCRSSLAPSVGKASLLCKRKSPSPSQLHAEVPARPALPCPREG